MGIVRISQNPAPNQNWQDCNAQYGRPRGPSNRVAMRLTQLVVDCEELVTWMTRGDCKPEKGRERPRGMGLPALERDVGSGIRDSGM